MNVAVSQYKDRRICKKIPCCGAVHFVQEGERCRRGHSFLKFISIALPLAASLSGCASVRGGWRLALGTGSGAAAGAAGGALLSPNDASRPLNALVFGLAGGLVGGFVAWVTEPKNTPGSGEALKEKELGAMPKSKQTSVLFSSDLPSFVRDRLTPLVIEEVEERDSISEDGGLHEPHRVFRIVKPPELSAKP